MKKREVFYGITTNVVLLGLASLLTDMSGEIITAILPLFLTSIGASTIIIGLIGGLSKAGISISNVISGHLSDKKGKRKSFIISGYTFAVITKFLLALSTTWPMVLIFRPLERIGKGIRDPPRDALMAETTERRVHGKVFGVHKALDNLGAIMGALLAFVLLWKGLGFNTAILISAIIASIALIPLYFLKEIVKQRKRVTLKVRLKRLSPKFKKFLSIVVLFGIANFGYMFFLLKAQSEFNNYTTPLLLYLFFTVSYTIFAIPGGIFSDKIGRKKTLIIGYLLFALTCLGFAFISSTFNQFAFLFSAYGLSKALFEPNQRAFASDLASKELGTAMGTFHMAIGLAALPAGLIAGALWAFISPTATFLFGAAVAAIAAWFFIKDRKLNY